MKKDNIINQDLKMTFDPNTIQHLGLKMYSHLPAAIAELVANAYDANASIVRIKLYDNSDEKSIVVEDNGCGMAFDDINKCFLVIGRNRRLEGQEDISNTRKVTGKKGLGKLALFGIGSNIEVSTKKKGTEDRIIFSLSWEDLKNWNKEKKGPDYKPTYIKTKDKKNNQGTVITISQLKRISKFSLDDIAQSISKMFNFLDSNFKVFLSLNDTNEIEITNELKYQSLIEQFNWLFPNIVDKTENDYKNKNLVKGKIFTTKTPLKPGQRGITLFANGRMVNAPEFFGSSESSHFFAYTTGWLDIDFIDELEGEDDVISTNRQSLDWEKEETLDLRVFLQKILSVIHKEWRNKRKEENKKESMKITGINRDQWLATLPVDKAEIINAAIDEVSDPDSDKGYVEIVETALHQIAPDYAELHWRYLHPEIHKISAGEYKKGNYFKATREAVLLYMQKVRDLAGIDSEDLGKIFNPGNGVLKVTECESETEKNIQNGHEFLSKGVQAGCRNPLTHNPEFEKHLINTGLFDEKVCLDMLATISHLFTRLDKAKKRNENQLINKNLK